MLQGKQINDSKVRDVILYIDSCIDTNECGAQGGGGALSADSEQTWYESARLRCASMNYKYVPSTLTGSSTYTM